MFDPVEYSKFMFYIRSFFTILDRAVYSLISALYQIFYNIASSSIMNGEVVRTLFGRVQLIFGVIVLFKLAITLMNGIINPDSVTDKKSGMGNALTRVIISLVMIVLIVPLNIPLDDAAPESYNAQLNNNGILFGTMYEFQNQLLKENTIGKIILGTDSISTNADNDLFSTYGDTLASTVLKTFVTVNINENTDTKTTTVDDYKTNAVCNSDDAALGDIEEYNSTTNVSTILKLATHDCGKSFVFSYSMIISTIVGGLFLLIMAGFTLDIAIRALKLIILRLIAPVPIIAYIDPKGESNFKAWTKAVLMTYIDVFVRIAVVFFIVFLCSQIDNIFAGLTINGGMVGNFSKLFIILGIFYFAKEAPKFLLESIGIKYNGGFFSGIGKMMGSGAALGGILGAGAAAYTASKAADKVNESGFHPLKNIGAGILGGVTGGISGMTAAAGAKDHYAKAATDKLRQRNELAIAQGTAGSTSWGRTKTSMERFFTGESDAMRVDREIATLQSQKDALSNVKSRVSGEMPKKEWTRGDLGIARDINGQKIDKVNYKDFMSRMNAAKSQGLQTVTFQSYDSQGNAHGRTISMKDAELQYGFLLKNNEDDYIKNILSGNQEDEVLTQLLDIAKNTGVPEITGRSSVNETIDSLGIEITRKKAQNETNKQNDTFSKK